MRRERDGCLGQALRCGMLALLAALPGGLALAQGQGAQRALLLPGLFVSQDSDDLVVQKTAVGAAPLYRNGNDYAVVKAAHHRYTSPAGSVEASQVSLARTRIDERGLGTQAGVGYIRLKERGLVTADIDLSKELSSSTSAGLFFVRDWVETSKALGEGISHNFLGISLDQRLGSRWGTTALLAQQHFSDENIRKHARVRLIYDLLPEQGLNLQFRHRHYWNSREATGDYFNPDVYYEDMIALGLRRHLLGWRLAVTLGVGSQRVSGDPPATTHLAELALASPLAARVFFTTRLGYSDSAALSGPGYVYRYLQADLMFSF